MTTSLENLPLAAEYAAAPPEQRNLIVVYKDNYSDPAVQEALRKRVKTLVTIPDRWLSAQSIGTTAGERYLDELDAGMGDNTDVIIFGGDGTTSRVLERLHAGDHKGLRVVLAGVGTKNDMAHTHGGSDHYDDPLHVLDHGRETELFPLQATFDKGGTRERIVTAFYVLGLGANAITARLADARKFRDARARRAGKPLETLRGTLADAWIVIDGVMRNAGFRTHKPGVAPGKQGWWRNFMAQSMDKMFAASERIAGGAVTMPTEPNNPSEIAVLHTPNRMHRIAINMARAALGLSQTIDGTYQTVLEDDVKVQKDGEYLHMLPAGLLEVRRSAKSIIVMNAAPAPRRYRGKYARKRIRRQSVTLAA